MKYSELKRLLRRQSARFKAHLGGHDLWEFNGSTTLISRHDNQEVPTGTLKEILKKLGTSVNKYFFSPVLFGAGLFRLSTYT